MNTENLIRALGTTEALTYLCEFLKPSVLLSRTPADQWEIMALYGFEIDKYVFDTIDQVQEMITGEIFFENFDKCLITKNEDREMKNLLKLYLDQSLKMEKLDEHKNNLTKFSYQLINLEKLVPSLLEPFPIELLLNLLIDSLGELFVSSAAAYCLNNQGKMFKIGYVGEYSFPVEMDQIENCCPGTVKKCSDRLVTSISDENGKQYCIVFRRSEEFKEEELSIMKTLIILIQKSRLLIHETEIKQKSQDFIDQFSGSLPFSVGS